MKLVPIALAATLACGAAFAQAPNAAQRAENRERAAEAVDRATPDAAQRAENRAKAGEVADKGVQGAKRVGKATKDGAVRAGQATKRGAKRAAEVTGAAAGRAAGAVRNTGESIARRLPPAPEQRELGSDTRAMGAGPSTTASASSDGDRRQRMDDAYDNYKRQQGNR